MATARLVYVVKDQNDTLHVLNLDPNSTTLTAMDDITRTMYEDVNSIEKKYSSRIEDFMSKFDRPKEANVKIVYIPSASKSVYLDPMCRTVGSEPVILRRSPNYINETRPKKPAVEKYRKLLFDSKNQMASKLAIEDKILLPTFNFSVRLTEREFKICTQLGLKCHLRELPDGYANEIKAEDLIRYRSIVGALGPLRPLMEDTLELWKNNLFSLSDEKLYYYSRQMLLDIDKYERLVRQPIGIKRLNVSNETENILANTRPSIQKVTQKLVIDSSYKPNGKLARPMQRVMINQSLPVAV